MRLQFYKVTDAYINHLKHSEPFDENVKENKNEKRPYVGIVFTINDIYDYFIPLSSPRPKHLKMKNAADFIKIHGGKYGVLNINNMIPVAESALISFDIRDIADVNYKNILFNQYRYCKDNIAIIKDKAIKLYHKVISNNPATAHDTRVIQRCCNFAVLEQKMQKFACPPSPRHIKPADEGIGV